MADKDAETVAIIGAGIGGIYLRPNWALAASSCASRISMRGTSCGSTATRSLKVASFALPGHPASMPSGRFLFLSVRC